MESDANNQLKDKADKRVGHMAWVSTAWAALEDLDRNNTSKSNKYDNENFW
jgi:hypothetical protein